MGSQNEFAVKKCIIRHTFYLFPLFLILLVVCFGCASTKEYSQFAQAGIVYYQAVDQLLVATANAQIDSNSEHLLRFKKIEYEDFTNKTQGMLSEQKKKYWDEHKKKRIKEEYDNVTNPDQKLLGQITGLRAHTKLLRDYFVLLNELATSDAPERAGVAMGGVAEGLTSLGKNLRASENIKIPDKDIIKKGTKFLGDITIRYMLRKELEDRYEDIQRELLTQQKLLEIISASIKTNLENINRKRMERLVYQPLIAETPEVPKTEEWVDSRRKLLGWEPRIAELEKAGKAAKELKDNFDNLVDGKLNLQRINTLLGDLETVLAIAQAVNR